MDEKMWLLSMIAVTLFSSRRDQSFFIKSNTGSQTAIGRLSMFITHKYAVMTLGVLVKLPVLDAVVDDLRVNAAAPQICKNTPVVGVFGWEGKFSFRERCGWL